MSSRIGIDLLKFKFHKQKVSRLKLRLKFSRDTLDADVYGLIILVIYLFRYIMFRSVKISIRNVFWVQGKEETMTTSILLAILRVSGCQHL